MPQLLYRKYKILLAKTGLLKQLWDMVLRFLSVAVGKNNSIEKWRQ